MQQTRTTSSRLPAALLLVATLAAAAPAAAQEPMERAIARTGLYTVQRGHSASLHLVDVGDRAEVEPMAAVIRLLDSRDRVVGRVEGVLRPGQPLRLVVPQSPAGNRNPVVLRAEATLVGPAGNFASRPILTLETLDERSADSFTAASCAIPWDPEGPGGRVTGDCGGCHVDVEAVQ